MSPETWVAWVVLVEFCLPQQSLPVRGEQQRSLSERGPCLVHVRGNLAPPERIGQDPAHLRGVGCGDGEGDILVQVHSLNVVALGHHLSTELLAQRDEPLTTEVVAFVPVFWEVDLGDIAQLDDETRDGLKGEAGDRLGDELILRVVGLGGEFEWVLVVHM